MVLSSAELRPPRNGLTPPSSLDSHLQAIARFAMAASRRPAPPGLRRPAPVQPSPFTTRGVNSLLSRRTPIFGIRAWILVAAVVAALAALLLFLICICSIRIKRRRLRQGKPATKPLKLRGSHDQCIMPPPPLLLPITEERVDFTIAATLKEKSPCESNSTGSTPPQTTPTASQLGWGQCYTLQELKEATGSLSEANVIGEGGYGIVYRGVLADGTTVAIKNLLDNRGQAEREFKVEVEAIGRVRHKNLVKLLGYCVDGDHRMLVYEYVNNGNLEQWLHGNVGAVSPLTWEIRMSIILGTAKGLAYLHEGLEPKVVHRDIKSGNILLDRQWNPKVADFGLAKLLCSERSHVTTRVMGTFGYVAPEYASSGLLNERSDIYSFGVLMMEIITGRAPVDYTRSKAEVNLVEWLKSMVSEKRAEELADPKLPEKPSCKALKRALLVALRCVDPDGQRRPKMGHVVHMLEMDDVLFHDERKAGLDTPISISSDCSSTTEERSFRRHGLQTRWR